MTPVATPAVVPELDGENTSLASATTSTVSVSAASCSVTGTSVASPGVTTTPDRDRVPKPLIATSTSRGRHHDRSCNPLCTTIHLR